MRYCDFPYFLYPNEIISEVKEKFVLTQEEQELLGLETLYKLDLKTEGVNSYEFLPYEYVKQHGVFNVLNIHDKLIEKLGPYRDFVIKCIRKNPNDLFSIHSLSPEEHLELLKLMGKDTHYLSFVEIIDKIQNDEIFIDDIIDSDEDEYCFETESGRSFFNEYFSYDEYNLNRYFDLVKENNKLYAVLNETGELLYNFHKRLIENKE